MAYGTRTLGSLRAHLPRHAVRVVAAARRERARRRRRGRRFAALGHDVTVLAPSTRAADLLAGRRVVHGHAPARDVVAVGPAVPISRRSQMGVPVGVRANLRLALAQGSFDVVHGFEPGLPSLSYLALRETDALTVATFCSTDRLGYPPARSQREKLLAPPRRAARSLRADPRRRRRALSRRLPARLARRRPRALRARPRSGNRSPSSCGRTSAPGARGVLHALRELPDWEAVLLRTKPLVGRPAIPRDLAGRVQRPHGARRRRARAAARRDGDLRARARRARPRVLLEAQAAGCAIAAPPGVERAARARGGRRGAARRGRRAPRARGRRPRAPRPRASRSPRVAAQLDDLYSPA